MARAIVTIVLVALAGCLPRTTVVKDPGPRDRGVRYYRSKPYLFLRPMIDKDGQPVDGMVELSIEYLPDYDQEYSIHVRTGLGTNHTQITLEDGWNLTSLNVDVDSQFDENLEAVGQVIGRVTPALSARNAMGGENMVVQATNVPMGLYEAVISAGPDGGKRLYGFRYVGFFPYAPCPIESGGLQCQSCLDGSVYALVFERGAMVFRPLVETATHVNTSKMVPTADGHDPLSRWVPQITAAVAERFQAYSGLTVSRSGGAATAADQVTVTLELTADSFAEYTSAPEAQRQQWHQQAIDDALAQLDAAMPIELVIIGPP